MSISKTPFITLILIFSILNLWAEKGFEIAAPIVDENLADNVDLIIAAEYLGIQQANSDSIESNVHLETWVKLQNNSYLTKITLTSGIDSKTYYHRCPKGEFSTFQAEITNFTKSLVENINSDFFERKLSIKKEEERLIAEKERIEQEEKRKKELEKAAEEQARREQEEKDRILQERLEAGKEREKADKEREREREKEKREIGREERKEKRQLAFENFFASEQSIEVSLDMGKGTLLEPASDVFSATFIKIGELKSSSIGLINLDYIFSFDKIEFCSGISTGIIYNETNQDFIYQYSMYSFPFLLNLKIRSNTDPFLFSLSFAGGIIYNIASFDKDSIEVIKPCFKPEISIGYKYNSKIRFEFLTSYDVILFDNFEYSSISNGLRLAYRF